MKSIPILDHLDNYCRCAMCIGLYDKIMELYDKVPLHLFGENDDAPKEMLIRDIFNKARLIDYETCIDVSH